MVLPTGSGLRNGNGLFAPRWFLATIAVAISLLISGWTLHDWWENQLRQIRAEQVAIASDQAGQHARILDSLSSLNRVVMRNTVRICRLEEQVFNAVSSQCLAIFNENGIIKRSR